MPAKSREGGAICTGRQSSASRCSQPDIDSLPEDLLLKVFYHLSRVGGLEEEETAWYQDALPFRKPGWQFEGHRGLRAYPFLSQVCQRWKRVLDSPAANELWEELTVDFGHEVVTSIHFPLAWSNRRPTEEEFRDSFAEVCLSADKILSFIGERRSNVRKLLLLNSEGYWSDEGDFVNLAQKHNFSLAHLGMLFGTLSQNLTEVTMRHCNDLFVLDGRGALGVLGLLPNLRVLCVENLRCHIKGEWLRSLSSLQKLEHLCISAEEQVGVWAVGLSHIPQHWSHLTSLRKLELRSNFMLESMPPFLSELSQLKALDVSFCRNLDSGFLLELTQLESLALQGLDLIETGAAQPSTAPYTKHLPDLTMLTNLTALNLSENRLTRVPVMLENLRNLRYLDLSGNTEMQVPHPLVVLTQLPHLSVVDLRSIHVERVISYWSNAKCVTMQNVTALAKNLRRRSYATHILMDTE